jgi:HNH endonuclease
MNKICTVGNCGAKVSAKGMCQKHYMRNCKHGDPNIVKRADNGSGFINENGYRKHRVGNKEKFYHRMIAEKALGRELRVPEEVHHVDENQLNNVPSNLVICPNHSYHALLHMRARAFISSGNANYRKCVFCKKYGDPSDMYINGGRANHRDCASAYERDRQRKMQANMAINPNVRAMVEKSQ